VITFVNGEYLDEEDAKISVFDRGLLFGDAVFDLTRTFGGEPFRLEAHLERLRKSLRYIEIPPNPIIDELREAIAEVTARNRDAIDALGDVAVRFVVTRGVTEYGIPFPGDELRPGIIVLLQKINFGAFASLYDTGVDLGISLATRHFSGATDRRVKSTNRLAATRGELKGVRMAQAEGRHPADFRAWTIVFADDGFVAEAHGANLFVVNDRRISRPPLYECLEGLTLDTVCELGRKMGLDVEERRLTLYDLINADETFICTASFQLLPVAAVDGIVLTHQTRDVYSKLMELYIELAGIDFVAQAKEKAAAQREEREAELVS
jgi:branched-chain amino acid aminotransferase